MKDVILKVFVIFLSLTLMLLIFIPEKEQVQESTLNLTSYCEVLEETFSSCPVPDDTFYVQQTTMVGETFKPIYQMQDYCGYMKLICNGTELTNHYYTTIYHLDKTCTTDEDCITKGETGQCGCGCYNKESTPKIEGECFCAKPQACQCVKNQCEIK